MFAVCWSVKGGSGTTVVAAALAVLLARRTDDGALLVDLAGDGPAALGVSEPDGPGLAGWFAAGRSVPADGLSRLEVPVGDGLALLPRGDGDLGPAERAEVLAGVLGAEGRSVVVDAGVPGWGDGRPDPARAVLTAAATSSLLVTRPCYLSLRRVVAAPLRPTGVVLVVEPGRALGRDDVEQIVGVPVVAEVLVDSAVARAVDAGLLVGRLPRSLERALGRAA
ncbi:MAG: nucleotide-binding protein [Acidimicrobiales bacterium]